MIWTLSNIISFARILLAAPLAYFLMNGDKLFASLTLALVMLSDVADGWIARRRNEITEAGKIIDPVADKIVAAVGVACMFLGNYIPAWFFWLVVGRDVAIVLLGSIAARKTGFVLPSNYAGKITVVLLSIAMALNFVTDSPLNMPSIWVATVAMIVSTISYALRFGTYMKNKKMV